MSRTALRLVLALALASAGAARADDGDRTPGLRDARSNSCGSDNFSPTKDAKGQVNGYTHQKIGLGARTQVGDAILEWCQSAKDAVVYFYVDNPAGPDHKHCAQNMSVALFPGEGANVRSIIDGNAAAYDDPAVRVVQPPKAGPVEIEAGGHTIDAYQLEGVMIDPVGQPRRHRMIGYARGADFVRVMTGTVDAPECRNEAAKTFLAKLSWP